MTLADGKRTWFAEIGAGTYEISVGDGGVFLNGQAVDAQLQSLGLSGEALFSYDGRSREVFATRKEQLWTIVVGGRTHTVRVQDERSRQIERLAGMGLSVIRENILRAPMPGLIVRIEVERGQAVQEGAPLVVMEAMKMENQLTAEAAGTVAAIEVREGSTVDKNDVLVRFER